MQTIRAGKGSIAATAFTALLAALCPAIPLAAQQPAAFSSDTTVRPAPIVTRGDLMVVGGGALLAFMAQKTDLRVRNEVRSTGWQENRTLDVLAETGNGWGGGAALVVGVGAWAGGRLAHKNDIAAIGLRSAEAMFISANITKGLKYAFGRARPRVDSLDAWDVKFGRGNDGDHESFPSGHATNAFAFAAAVTSETARRAPERAVLVGVTSYTLAGVTAYARLHSDAHWLSDVTMGAAIGMATGWAVTRFHATRPGGGFDHCLLGADVSPFVTSGTGGRTYVGATLTWR